MFSPAPQPASSSPPPTHLNLTWISDRLALGGAFASGEAAHLAGDLGIRAVIDMREEEKDDEAELARHGIAHLHLPTLDHHAAAGERLDRGVAFAAGHIGRGGRVLVHCQHGIGRAPLMALCLLVHLGEAPEAALRRVKQLRPVASPSPAQYRAWSAWLSARGQAAPDFADYCAIAYAHLIRG